jgi:hypothetical protein
MANIVSKIIFRKGSTTDRSQIILEDGEPGWDNTLNELYVGNGSVSGGVPVTLSVDSDAFLLYNDGNPQTKNILQYPATTKPNHIVASGNISTTGTVECNTLSVGSISPTGAYLDFGTVNLSGTDLTIVSGATFGQSVTDSLVRFDVRSGAQFTKNTNFLDSIYVTKAVNCKSMATDIIVQKGSSGITLSGNNTTNPALSVTNTIGHGMTIGTDSSTHDALKLVHNATSPSGEGVLCIKAPNAVSGDDFDFISCYNNDYAGSSYDSSFKVGNNGVTISTRNTNSALSLNSLSGANSNTINVTYTLDDSLLSSLSGFKILRATDKNGYDLFYATPQGKVVIQNFSSSAGTGTAKVEINSIYGDDAYVSHNVGGAAVNQRYIRSGAVVDGSNNSFFCIQSLSGTGLDSEVAQSVKVDSLSGNFIPGRTGVQDLGSSTAKWDVVYCNTVNADSGATGTIDTTSSQTITVVDGIITSIA